jgi:hypothetical protein
VRRAQTHWNLIALIIVLASIMIGIVVIISFNGVWRSNAANIDCSAQIRAHVAAQKYSKEKINPSTIRCPTNQVTVTGENQAKAAIAREMLRCFDQWGRGELPLFGDQTGTYCHVCGTVTVQGASQVRGMTEYLDTQKAGRGDLTYLQALIGTTRGDLYTPQNAPAASDDTLSTAQPLGVIFRYEKGAQVGQQVKNWLADPVKSPILGVAGGLTLGVAAGVGAVPLAILAVGGGILGASVGFSATEPLDTLASVSVRPLDAGSISALGCDYLPVNSN